MVSLLALAGVGISYAGWTDTIEVTGSVNTGTVTWEVIDYSGTWVWKDIPNHGRAINYGVPIDYDLDGIVDDDPNSALYDNPDYELVAKSWAQEGTGEFDVEVFFENLYPCVWFKADIVIKYTGTIPGRINDITYGWDPLDDWIEPLITDGNIYATFRQGQEVVELGDQLHENDEVTIELWIHIPQDQALMLKTGSFTATIEVVQWNEYPYDHSGECGKNADLEVLKVADSINPAVGGLVEFTITAINNGPDVAKNAKVEDILPGELIFVSANPSVGSYDDATGIWDIGDMGVGSETLTIVARIAQIGTFHAKTQLGMVIDGSGSIDSTEWALMLEGIATALRDPNIFPHDGSVELTIVQFADHISGNARVEIGPIIIVDDSTDPGHYDDVATDVENIDHAYEYTPLADGINLTADTMAASTNNPQNGGDFTRQVVNIVTDGAPNRPLGNGYGAAEAASAYMVSTLNMLPGEDEIDAEGIGISTFNIDWLKTSIVWPQPGNLAPPFIPGWVRDIADFEMFADTIGEKFKTVFQSITNCAEIDSSATDEDTSNNIACITLYPIELPPNTVESSAMHFEGDLDESRTGVYVGTIDMTMGEYYVTGGPGELIWDQGGFDVFALQGGAAFVQGYYGTGDWNVGGETDTYQIGYLGEAHDGYPSATNGGPWGSWYDPDVADYYNYQLTLTETNWYLEYKGSALGTPMSGTIDWTNNYALETDTGMYRGTVPSDPDANDGDAALHGGGPGAWDMDWTWGSEVSPLEHPGFDVSITPATSGYHVILTPAATP